MLQNKKFQYDVVLSFAGEQRNYVNEVANVLKKSKIRVFYDSYETVDLWGKDLYTHLDDIYQFKSEYCVMFLSIDYARKAWTNHERQSAQARAFQENKEYILPVRFDETEIPGVRKTVGYIDANIYTPDELAKLIIRKLNISQSSELKVCEGEVVDLTTMCFSFPETAVCSSDTTTRCIVPREYIKKHSFL